MRYAVVLAVLAGVHGALLQTAKGLLRSLLASSPYRLLTTTPSKLKRSQCLVTAFDGKARAFADRVGGRLECAQLQFKTYTGERERLFAYYKLPVGKSTLHAEMSNRATVVLPRYGLISANSYVQEGPFEASCVASSRIEHYLFTAAYAVDWEQSTPELDTLVPVRSETPLAGGVPLLPTKGVSLALLKGSASLLIEALALITEVVPKAFSIAFPGSSIIRVSDSSTYRHIRIVKPLYGLFNYEPVTMVAMLDRRETQGFRVFSAGAVLAYARDYENLSDEHALDQHFRTKAILLAFRSGSTVDENLNAFLERNGARLNQQIQAATRASQLYKAHQCNDMDAVRDVLRTIPARPVVNILERLLLGEPEQADMLPAATIQK